jgi:hypothetical protein
MRGHGRRKRVVLISQRSPNRCKPKVSVESGIDLGLSGTGNDLPTYPGVDPVSCREKVGQGRSPMALRLLFRAD